MREHRILKVNGKYRMQEGSKNLFGSLAWENIVYEPGGLLSTLAEYDSPEDCVRSCRDRLQRGEVIPIIETVVVP